MATLDDRMAILEHKMAGIALAAGDATDMVPADLLDLRKWHLTLPYTDPATGVAREIKQPDLASFTDPAFCVNPHGPGVLFTVHQGDTGLTKGSTYPRSELREDINFDPRTGTHALQIFGYVQQETTVKPHIVTGQIHDLTDDIATFRMEGTTLYRTNGNDSHNATITTGLALSTPYALAFVISGGKIRTFYNGSAASGVPDIPVPNTAANWYFKAGDYLQSNNTKAPGEDPNAAGIVVITSLATFHAP